MPKLAIKHQLTPLFIRVYLSFGSNENVMVFGHTFKEKPYFFKSNTNNMMTNMVRLLKVFSAKTLKGIKLKLNYFGETHFTVSEFDGFFRFDFRPIVAPAPGWHDIAVSAINENGDSIAIQKGKIFVPPVSAFAYISDIDDTMLKSYSATIFRRLYELLSRNPVKRRLFDNTSVFYNALADSNRIDGLNNPFFYVSSSEWNLYSYLRTVFNNHRLPDGIFLLNSIKSWVEIIATGKTGHVGKLMRITRVILAYPEQRFILLGDNSQKDPEIYAAIANRYKNNVYAILIRNVRKEKESETVDILSQLQQKGILTYLFNVTQEAIAFCKQTGLITPNRD